MTIEIIECDEPDELFRHYDGQSGPQPCYIELDLVNGVLSAEYDSIVGSGAPATVHHGQDRRWSIPMLTAKAANRVMEEILPLANRIHADWEDVWDGSNHVAKLGADALAAEEEIEEKLEHGYVTRPYQGFDERDLVSVWDISGVTNGCEVSEYSITADTTDERLGQIEAEIMSDMVSVSQSEVAVCHGLDSYLRELRDDLKRERDDTG